MTTRKITYALKRIDKCKQDGFYLEAILTAYHLNLELIRFIPEHTVPGYSARDKKLKQLTRELKDEFASNKNMAAVISKSNFKAVKIWLSKTDQFFRVLKVRRPTNTRDLLTETEKILTILHISVNKLFGNK